ncbi:MAG: hypothetical protein JWM91_4708 [Rhodospirillales bacterium]|nr:hypothetical protein [Rhodospirillales bacterium]
MYAVNQLGLWLDRFQHSRFARDLARDWRYWSRIERITACSVLVVILMIPAILVPSIPVLGQ